MPAAAGGWVIGERTVGFALDNDLWIHVLRVPSYVGPEHAVMERMEPSVPASRHTTELLVGPSY
jgi:hypothetical protein